MGFQVDKLPFAAGIGSKVKWFGDTQTIAQHPLIREPGGHFNGSSEYVAESLSRIIQLGQFSVNPPRLLLEVGGTST